MAEFQPKSRRKTNPQEHAKLMLARVIRRIRTRNEARKLGHKLGAKNRACKCCTLTCDATLATKCEGPKRA